MAKLACPKCYQRNPNSPSIVSELNRYVDAEGFVAAKVMCTCGFTADIRVVQDSPPCTKCGHVDRRLLRGNPQIVGAPTDSLSVLNSLRGPGEQG